MDMLAAGACCKENASESVEREVSVGEDMRPSRFLYDGATTLVLRVLTLIGSRRPGKLERKMAVHGNFRKMGTVPPKKQVVHEVGFAGS